MVESTSSQGGGDDWGLDYEMGYEDDLNLNRIQSKMDEP